VAEPTILAEIAADLLATAAQCLEDAGRPVECTFVGHGLDAVPRRSEYLSVQQGVGVPTVNFPTPATTTNPACEQLIWAETFVLRLHRCPYPHIQRTDPPEPSPAELTAASEGLMNDKRILQCCLPRLWADATGDFLSNPNLAPAAGFPELAKLEVIWGTIAPFRQGNKAGWDWPIQVGVAPCCDEVAPASGS